MEIDDKDIKKKNKKAKKSGGGKLFSDDLNRWRKEDQSGKSEKSENSEKPDKQKKDKAAKPIAEPAQDGAANAKKTRSKWSTKSKVLFICMSVLLAAIITVGAIALSIWTNPLGQLETVADQIDKPTNSPEAQASQSAAPTGSAGPTPTGAPTLSPYEELMAYADLSLLENTVNIMLIGVDYAVERDTWGGKKAFHSDVMIVLSINTVTKEVDLISLPRDTYANIPGVEGIYKLNASIDCGGGWPTQEGFEKVCEAAEWMLGGIPVDYYYAVDMGAVKGLVNAIGGLTYEIEMDFTMQGRSYTAGVQYMDGQAVLDYLRVRKNIAQSGDLNRINRQKDMLVAIFEKIKRENLLAQLPTILDAFGGNLYTNLSLTQTAGLAAFAYSINSDEIEMHSMGGKYHNIFNWRFVITNQTNRRNIVEDVYGIRPRSRYSYDEESAKWLWENMQLEVILEKTEPLLPEFKALLDADALLPPMPTPAPSPPPTPTPDPSASPAPSPSPTPTPTPPPTPPPGGYRKYDSTVWELYNEIELEYFELLTWELDVSGSDLTDEIIIALKTANIQFKLNIETLCEILEIDVPKWRVNYEKYENEVVVDFN